MTIKTLRLRHIKWILNRMKSGNEARVARSIINRYGLQMAVATALAALESDSSQLQAAGAYMCMWIGTEESMQDAMLSQLYLHSIDTTANEDSRAFAVDVIKGWI